MTDWIHAWEQNGFFGVQNGDLFENLVRLVNLCALMPIFVSNSLTRVSQNILFGFSNRDYQQNLFIYLNTRFTSKPIVEYTETNRLTGWQNLEQLNESLFVMLDTTIKYSFNVHSLALSS
jgi:hypothetical protein